MCVDLSLVSWLYTYISPSLPMLISIPGQLTVYLQYHPACLCLYLSLVSWLYTYISPSLPMLISISGQLTVYLHITQPVLCLYLSLVSWLYTYISPSPVLCLYLSLVSWLYTYISPSLSYAYIYLWSVDCIPTYHPACPMLISIPGQLTVYLHITQPAYAYIYPWSVDCIPTYHPACLCLYLSLVSWLYTYISPSLPMLISIPGQLTVYLHITQPAYAYIYLWSVDCISTYHPACPMLISISGQLTVYLHITQPVLCLYLSLVSWLYIYISPSLSYAYIYLWSVDCIPTYHPACPMLISIPGQLTVYLHITQPVLCLYLSLVSWLYTYISPSLSYAYIYLWSVDCIPTYHPACPMLISISGQLTVYLHITQPVLCLYLSLVSWLLCLYLSLVSWLYTYISPSLSYAYIYLWSVDCISTYHPPACLCLYLSLVSWLYTYISPSLPMLISIPGQLTVYLHITQPAYAYIYPWSVDCIPTYHPACWCLYLSLVSWLYTYISPSLS